MTDREMLLFAYGALKISAEDNTNMSLVVTMVEDHLWPTPSADLPAPGSFRAYNTDDLQP